MCWSIVVLSSSLEWKSDKSTKHYINQMLLAINWHYWQAGKDSHMHMEVQGCLMQACFIEIQHVFEKKKLDTFLTEWYFLVHSVIILTQFLCKVLYSVAKIATLLSYSAREVTFVLCLNSGIIKKIKIWCCISFTVLKKICILWFRAFLFCYMYGSET